MINGSIRKTVRSGRLSLRWTSVVVSALSALKLRGTPENLLLAGNASTYVCLRACPTLPALAEGAIRVRVPSCIEVVR